MASPFHPQQNIETDRRMNGGSRYRAIHVLLIRWKNEKDVLVEMNELGKVLARNYKAEVHNFDIPSQHAARALETRLQNFKQRYSKRGNLLIVYYAGHGSVGDKANLTWVADSCVRRLHC
jgi:hypothetical protein